MKKKSTAFTVKLRVAMLGLLAVASVIAAVTFFAAPIDAAERNALTQQEVWNESPESSPVPATGTTGSSAALLDTSLDGYHYPSVSTTGIAAQYQFDYCVLAPAVEPTGLPDQIHSGNAIRIPKGMCIAMLMGIADMYNRGQLSPEDLIYPVNPM